jgi:hypothetical protein
LSGGCSIDGREARDGGAPRLNEIRRIYFGDNVIPEADRLPDRNGYSVGRW